MLLELIAVVVAGVMGAGVVLILRKVTRGALPGWLVPVAAGLAMLGTSISSEYSWYARTSGAMPDSMVVAKAVHESVWWRPWTFAVPMIPRYVAVDTGAVSRNDREEDLYMAELYFFARWEPIRAVQMMVDCAGGRRATPSGGDGGDPAWREVGMQDPIVATVCRAV